MPKMITLPIWQDLKAEHERLSELTLNDLFIHDPERARRFDVRIDGLAYDFSRTHVTNNTLDLLIKLAEARRVPELRARLFRGEKINNTENRAVLHMALRSDSKEPLLVDDVNVRDQVDDLHDKMAAFVNRVHEGTWRGATGEPIKTIVNIGIGGSDLGPRLVVEALRQHKKAVDIRFVANVDIADMKRALDGLEPERTLFIVVSKSFNTQETIMNAAYARDWIVEALGPGAVTRHFAGVSANEAALAAFGISPAQSFPMWDWVGGRFSLWSSVGLVIALAVGWPAFAQLLAGAASMDHHFQWAPLRHNMPVLMGILSVWYRNLWGAPAQAILPYDERLRELPRFLQQLEMESNGKSVTYDGLPVSYQTAPLVFGECGTVGQHSFHQWLHQGTQLVLSDFIGVVQDDWGVKAHHEAVLANLYAQAEALKTGERDKTAPYRSNPGNKPSQMIMLDSLTPFNLGLLLALYEHKVFVEGAIWDINSFDQFGVELGKKMAKQQN